MKFSVFTSILVTSLIVSGCSSAPKATWKKPGISQHNINNSMQKCRYDIGMAKVSREKENYLFKACMRSEGNRYR